MMEFKKALGIDRHTILTINKENNKTFKEIIPFVTTHNPNNVNISHFSFQLINTLKQSTDTNSIFKHSQFINSKRQAPNLKLLLCKSRFSTDNNTINYVTKCNDKRCGTCKYIIETHEIKLNSISIKFNETMNCASKNIIYALICQGCSEFYIGETGNTLRERTRVHKQQINDYKYRQLQVSKHVHECGQNNFNIIPIHALKADSTTIQRRSKVNYYIAILKQQLNIFH